jgi:hypothetical protein
MIDSSGNFKGLYLELDGSGFSGNPPLTQIQTNDTDLNGSGCGKVALCDSF